MHGIEKSFLEQIKKYLAKFSVESKSARKKNIMKEFKYSNCNLPVLIGSKEEMDNVMNGEFTFKPMLSREDHSKLVNMLKENYDLDDSYHDQVMKGYTINSNELLTETIYGYPLEFQNDNFVAMDQRYLEFGDTAVVIFNLPVIIDQLQGAFKSIQPYIYDVAVSQPRYVDDLITLQYESCNKMKSSQWSKEMLIQAKIRNEVNFAEMVYPGEQKRKIDPINIFAVELPLKKLVEGDFSEIYKVDGIKEYMNSLKPFDRQIHSYHKKFMVDLREIEPTNKWIEKFNSILDPSEWTPISFSEKLREDGDSLARLRYISTINQFEIITFGINYVSFDFEHYGEREKKIFEDIIDFLDQQFKRNYTGLYSCIKADLGNRFEKYYPLETFNESYSIFDKGVENSCLMESHLQIIQSLMTENRVVNTTWNIGATLFVWRYEISICTPLYEQTLYYNKNDLKNYFDDTDKYMLSVIDDYMECEDPFVKFENERSKYFND